ncbi:MAG: SGNH/GDSL hydrolase family protein [Planctomycetota bacterium]|jgi:lysophospholipase L1-like esterase|nr:SGNH/GDSL hydrolase family protein [Planctomycetota bacterium]
MTKTIVCYGDSNTWGAIPGPDKKRYPPDIRWPNVMGRLLPDGFRVYEEGLCGRTTVHDDPIEGSLTVDKNGKRTLGAILDTHSPVDLVVIMLGTNDLKPRFAVSAYEIAAGVELLAHTARDPLFGPGLNSVPDVLVVCPPPIEETGDFFGTIFAGGKAKSLQLSKQFKLLGERSNIPILYAGQFVKSDPVDGIHLSAESHAALAGAVADWVKARFGA